MNFKITNGMDGTITLVIFPQFLKECLFENCFGQLLSEELENDKLQENRGIYSIERHRKQLIVHRNSLSKDKKMYKRFYENGFKRF